MSQQCKEIVSVRDAYRVDRRNPSGFSMHYTQKRCKRFAKPNGYCWQHQQARAAAGRERGEP